MTLAPGRVFRKTELGLVAVNTRPREVSARARTALILVNGRESVAELGAKIGPDAPALIESLLDMGLIEDVPAPAAAPRAPSRSATPTSAPKAAPEAAAAPAPAPPPAADPAEAAAMLARLQPLKREVVRRLAPQFGPDVDVICQPLIAATTEETWRAALGAIETKLAIYLGRAGAKRMLEDLQT